ncbi:MAG: methylated-DNA--[protein]-cysteine S-methyltransferase [Chloroflexi bacterium]|nr:methylated-DNA--[protein]-cysteine S-methyltransferase [Chloroflexota bacterium]
MKSIDATLIALRQREKIPASTRRAEIRARVLDAFPEIGIAIFNTRLGWIGIAWNARGIVALNLPRATRANALRDLQREFSDAIVHTRAPDEIERELREYVAGTRREFRLALDWSAIGAFQRAVLQAARKIPFGETRSYGWIAQQIGNPRASRAVGRALGANPIPIILPCHRVIASDGGLGGYGGGLPLKRKLLQLEGAVLDL